MTHTHTHDTGFTPEAIRRVPFAGLAAPIMQMGAAVTTILTIMERGISKRAEARRVRRVERQTVDALRGLDDHVLRDIGIARSDIARVAHDTARQHHSDFRRVE